MRSSAPVDESSGGKVTYWHRRLPPLDAEIVGEHTIEESSRRVEGSIAHRDELWRDCYEDLIARTEARLEREVRRLDGDYARVFDEVIDSRRDEVKGETWLRGRFSYMLYRRPRPRGAQPPASRPDASS